MRTIKMMRKTVLSSLIIAAAFVPNVSAMIDRLLYMPTSSYAEQEDNWQGFRLHEEGNFSVLVEYTVYDTDNLGDPAEQLFVDAMVDQLGLTGQYIYAYQLSQNTSPGFDELMSFSLLSSDGNDLAPVTDINSYDDDSNGLSPFQMFPEEVKWKWGQDNLLSTGEHSFVLAFSSIHAPVVGDYKITGYADSDSGFPGEGEVPEPATVLLLGLGSTVLFAKRKKRT